MSTNATKLRILISSLVIITLISASLLTGLVSDNSKGFSLTIQSASASSYGDGDDSGGNQGVEEETGGVVEQETGEDQTGNVVEQETGEDQTGSVYRLGEGEQPFTLDPCKLDPKLPQCNIQGSRLSPDIPTCAFPGQFGCEPEPQPPTPEPLAFTLDTCKLDPTLPQCQNTPTTSPPLFGRNIGNTPLGFFGQQPTTAIIPKSKTGDILAPPSSELQTGLPNTVLTQKPPDTLFTGRDTVPGGGILLRDPVLVPGPDEEGAAPDEEEEECVAVPYEVCNFPYPISQDEICRNGVDDDLDGKVDETIYCTEVPGVSKPRPPDGILTPIPAQGPSPFAPPQR